MLPPAGWNFMNQGPMDELEAGVDRLLAAYSRVKDENLQLRERVSAMEKQQVFFRERLDSLLAKLEKVELQ